MLAVTFTFEKTTDADVVLHVVQACSQGAGTMGYGLRHANPSAPANFFLTKTMFFSALILYFLN